MYTLTIKSDKIPDNFTGMVEWVNGYKSWYKDGELHRLDGPAYEGADGTKYWYKDGKQFTESEFNTSNEIPCEVVINGIAYKLVKQA